jgi:hypothetical protein
MLNLQGIFQCWEQRFVDEADEENRKTIGFCQVGWDEAAQRQQCQRGTG